MTDKESALAPQFDTGPLSWVIGEIRDALERSATALREAAAAGADAQPTLLLHAKTHLHQAHGALQVVDIAAVEQLTEAGERVIDRARNGELPLDGARVDAIGEVYRALVEYLEELLAGSAPQPVRLFPYYQSLQEMLGADRAHPGALLVLAPAPRLPGAAAQGLPDYAAARARFEKALLPFLKSADAAQRAHAGAMRDALSQVVQAHGEPRAHAFWLALATVADLVASGQVPADLYVKQLFGQINLLLRRMTQGHTELPDGLLRDALFFVAAAPEPTGDARVLRAAWSLEGQVPQDWQARRYGRVDPAALRDARQALLETKEGWDRIASEGPAAAKDGEFREALAKLAGASEQLGAPALPQLLRELGQAASKSLAGAHNDQFTLEMATAMLFVEHGLDQLRELPEEFGQHAGEVGQRLLALAQGQNASETPQWQGDLARALQQGQTVAVLAGEIRASLHQVEKLIEEFHQDPSRGDALAQVDPLLHQLHGALAILDQGAAMRAVDHARSCLATLASGNLNPSAHESVITNLAHNISALGFFTDALAQNVDLARRRYRFDDAALLLREQPLDAAVPAQEPAPAPAAEPVPEPAEAAAAPAQDHQAVEAELLEIFISEAHEVLDLVARNLPAAHAVPGDQER
jgi:chemosensory pili system protein ChpA (sensor histidine kinase/response regulator)